MALNYFFIRLCKKYSPRLFLNKSYSELSYVKEVVCTSTKKIQKPPFMKNIFLGVVDKDILSFPEVETLESDNEAPLQLQTNALVNESEPFTNLLKSGVCRLGYPKEYGGIPCNSMFLLNEIEKLDITPTNSMLVEMQRSLIIESILTYGSESQKEKYVRDLISGTIIGSYALHEEGSGSDPASIECVCSGNENCDGTYIMNGEKNWITNAHKSNFFIVLAQVKETNRTTSGPEVSAFILDKDTPGVTITKEFELDEFVVSKVKFDNVSVTPDHVLGSVGDGFKVAVSNLESSKFVFAASVLNLIRKLLAQVTSHVSKANRFPTPLRDHEIIQSRLSNLVATLYALESSTYLLAGMKDLYSMDTSLESVIVHNLMCSYGVNAVTESVNLIGSRALVGTDPLVSAVKNLPLLLRAFHCPEILNLFIALKGVEHSGTTLSESVRKGRNPLDFPGFVIKRILNSRRQLKDSPKLDKQLYMELHPSLKMSADQLEYCISRFNFIIEMTLVKQGANIVKKQLHLFKMSEIACDIFTMVAVLARASRSYCTGIRYSDQELMIAQAWCDQRVKSIKFKISLINEDHLSLDENLYLSLAPDILSNKGYFLASPIEKNII